MLSFSAKRYYNGTVKTVQYDGTLQPDGYVYFNDNRRFRGRYDSTNRTLTDIQVLYESKNQWIRASGLIDMDSSTTDYSPTNIIATGNVREAINLAEGQIGNDGRRYWNWYSDNVYPLAPFIDGSQSQWCAVFISWLLAQVGATSTYFPNTFAFDYRDIPVNERIAFNDLQPGDIVSFNWSGGNTGDHVGLVTGLENGILYTIEGNTDGGYVLKRQRYSSQVLFGIRPTYAI